MSEIKNPVIIGLANSKNLWHKMHTILCAGKYNKKTTVEVHVNYETFRCHGSKCRIHLRDYTGGKTGPYVWCKSCHGDCPSSPMYTIIECNGDKCRNFIDHFDNTTPFHCESCYGELDEETIIKYAQSVLPDVLEPDFYGRYSI